MTRFHDPALTVLDADQFREPATGCVYLLRGAKNALIDTGTAANAPQLLQSLRDLRLDYIFVTHLHLDHAGAAGQLAAAHPESLIVAHPRGVPHLADPTRLAAGVKAASPDLAPLYGEPISVDPERLVSCENEDSFELGGGRRLVAIETPGHAPHHVCFFDPTGGVLFVGDAVGHHGVPVDVPLTVPPRFDVDATRESVRRLIELHPRTLAFAHFGVAHEALSILAAYPHRVEQWLAYVGGLRARLGDDHTVDAVLAEPRNGMLSDVGRNVLRMCVRGALLTLDAETSPRAKCRGRDP